MDKMPCPDTFPDIISVRSFISKQFPTLLAIREIIADAIVLPTKVIPAPPLRLAEFRPLSAATTPAYAALLHEEVSNASRRKADT